MKRISIIILAIMAAMQSCKLESEMYDAINPTIFPKNAEDATALLAGNCYNVFQSNGYDGIFTVASGGILVSADLTCDYGECEWRDREPVMYGRWLIGNGYLTRSWGYVKNISSMTLTIDRISGIEMDEALKNQYIAELRCGKGFLAFLLYDYYGPIPIADLETLKNPLAEIILPRASEEEMQTFIETELTEAAKGLPYSYKKGDANYGHFTKGVCYMVLLKFYMMTKQWDKAEAAGRELLKSEYGYNLVPVYKDIFTLANEKNKETIFSFNSLKGYQEQKWHPHVLPTDFPTPEVPNQVKWGGYRISWPFMHTFEAGDQRLETIVTEFTGTGGTQHNEALDATGTTGLRY